MIWYTLQWDGPALQCPKWSNGMLPCHVLACARRDRTVCCFATLCRGLVLRRCTQRDGIVRCFALPSIVWYQEGCSLLASGELSLAQHHCCPGWHYVLLQWLSTAAVLNLHSCPLFPPHFWLAHGQGHRPCPSHYPAGHRGGAKAHNVRAAALGGKILRTLGSPYSLSPHLW